MTQKPPPDTDAIPDVVDISDLPLKDRIIIWDYIRAARSITDNLAAYRDELAMMEASGDRPPDTAGQPAIAEPPAT